MDYKGILSAASSLKQKSYYKITIADYSREILLQINSMILNIHKAKMASKCSFNLPVNFDPIEGVTNKQIQTVVYYNVINELKTKGYEVNLRLTKGYSTLLISWEHKIENIELQKMKELLESVIIKDK